MDIESIRKEEAKLFEENYEMHRWRRLKSDIDSWQIPRMLITIGISLMLGILGYSFSILKFNVFVVSSIIGVGIFMGGLLVNRDIRAAFYGIFGNQHDNILDIHKKVKYYFWEGHQDVIFIQTETEFTVMGLFRLKAIPLTIKANLERLMRDLYKQNKSVFWIYTQGPLTDEEILNNSLFFADIFENNEIVPNTEPESLDESHPQMGVVHILLGTRSTFKLTSKIDKMYQEVSSNLFQIGTIFRGAYPHVTLEPLHGQELYRAFRIACGVMPV